MSRAKLPAGYVITGRLSPSAPRVDCGTSNSFTPPVPYPDAALSAKVFRDRRGASRWIKRAADHAETLGSSLVEGCRSVRELCGYVGSLRVESLRKRAKQSRDSKGYVATLDGMPPDRTS